MIGSFWNLCRACPSMPVDKLHSEYRSTYRWHEYTGPRQEVVRRPPQANSTAGPNAPNTSGITPAAGATSARAVPNRSTEEDLGDGTVIAPRFEPALPRRKKHPELAYRTHEFISMSQVIGSDDSIDSTIHFDRARSEERGGERMRSGRRSKSEGPRREYRLHYLKVASPALSRRAKVLRSDSDPCDSNGPEHTLFGWPRGRSGSSRRAAPGAAVRAEDASRAATVPRKSLSMGAIRPTAPAAIHRKRNTDYDRPTEGAAELDPLVTSGTDKADGPSTAEQEDLRGEEKIQIENLSKEDKPRPRKEFKTEYKKKFRPFSQYDYVEGKFQKKKDDDSQLPLLPDLPHSDSWYREVLELRKKAGEYKHRGWGTELVPLHIAELYNKQMTLWEQVSRRSSLSALSLASTAPRSITKEEKEKENNKKSSPTKPFHRLAFSRPSTATDKTLNDKKREKSADKDVKKEGPRSRKEFLVRHHLERTTGSVDGALLPSPTREKLEPVIPRQKEEDLPKSPQKSGSPKSSPRTARSQSVGPAMLSGDRRSPKRQPAAAAKSAAPAAANAAPAAPAERRPRPISGLRAQPASRGKSPATTSLTTTAPYRPKSNVGSFKAEDEKSHQVTKPKPLPAKTAAIGAQGDRARTSKGKVGAELKPSGSCDEEKGTMDDTDGGEAEEPELEQQTSLEYEPLVVKSPPEPTRVKSPEQILMRSPEPVNWTVPLDTGKTFTVTQNIHQAMPNAKFNRGDFINRPHSEVKAWTPPAVPPPAPQSAPPQLPHEWKSSTSEPHSSNSLENLPAVNGFGEKSPPPTSAVAGTTLRCLEDPMDEVPRRSLQDPSAPTGYPLPETQSQSNYRVLEAPSPGSSPVDPYKPLPVLSPSASRSMASDVLDKARNRFDMFWGKGKDDTDGNV